MKLKNKILLSLFLTVGILFIWNLTAEAKTAFPVQIPFPPGPGPGSSVH